MNFTAVFLNCGPQPAAGESQDWKALANAIITAGAGDLSLIGVCEVYGAKGIEKLSEALQRKLKEPFHPILTTHRPAHARIAILIRKSRAIGIRVADDSEYRTTQEGSRWIAAKITPEIGARTPVTPFYFVATHWPSMSGTGRDTIVERELLAWEIGRWMTERTDGQYCASIQPCLLMGDLNCEPHSIELRLERKRSIQALRNPPELWEPACLTGAYSKQHALMYDLSWLKLTDRTDPKARLPGTYKYKSLHTPHLLDRVLVTPKLWKGEAYEVTDRKSGMQIHELGSLTDHSAISVTLKIK